MHHSVFLLRQDKLIDVYQETHLATRRFTKCNRIDITELTFPNDIAACDSNKRLYVSDCRNYGVWMIRHPLSANPVVEHFAKLHSPQGMSITADGCVVVTMEVPFNICVYYPNGRLALNIPLYPHITDPRQAVLTSDGHFIVCSGVSMTQKHSVAKIALKRGQILVKVCILSAFFFICRV